MHTLLIETSTERGFVAIFKDIDCLFEKELPFGYNNSKYILPVIDEVLQKAGLKPKQLQLISVGVGPGSYTGIRVGAIIGKTLSYACKLPLIGICTLETFLPDRDCSFAVIVDAKIGGAYVLKGQQSHGVIHYTSQAALLSLIDLEAQLEETEVLLTPYKEVLQTKLKELYPKSTWEWQEKSPSPEQMALRTRSKFTEGAFSMDSRLDLLYLRKTQAEIEKASK